MKTANLSTKAHDETFEALAFHLWNVLSAPLTLWLQN